jgi:hypothetical protein
MNVGQITMPVSEARRRIAAYRGSRYAEVDEEYRTALKAYRALAKGTPLLVLSQAIALAPLDEKGRPRLAIARADEREVQLRCFSRQWRFGPSGWMRANAYGARATLIADPRARFETPDGFAMVPMVPPEVRGDRRLEAHWILWEVEKWADASALIRPDRDPLLLRRLSGGLYAVVGQWDLTEVERPVMQGTRVRP